MESRNSENSSRDVSDRERRVKVPALEGDLAGCLEFAFIPRKDHPPRGTPSTGGSNALALEHPHPTHTHTHRVTRLTRRRREA